MQIVVETVGGDTRLIDRELRFVHLEGGSHMLGIAHHSNRNVAYQHDALKSGAFPIEFLKHAAHLIRRLPVGMDDIGRQTIVLHGITIFQYGLVTTGECCLIGNHSKSSGMLFLRLNNNRFSNFHHFLNNPFGCSHVQCE